MKPRILITMHYMELGGAESALLGLLQAHDPVRADMDLFLYAHRGELMQFLPLDKIHLLPEIQIYSLLESPIIQVLKLGYWKLAIARLLGKFEALFYERNNKNGLVNVCSFTCQERRTVKVLPPVNPNVEYDLAISFNNPHYVVLEKVKAKKKLGWIHTDYTKVFLSLDIERQMWGKLDYIASISEEVGKKFCEVFPDLRLKILPIENILYSKFIQRRAEEYEPQEINQQIGCYNLLSIGRYSYPKRFDEIGTICSSLIKELKSLNFEKKINWFIVGYGPLEEEQKIRINIESTGMQNNVFILGKRSNPYPYIKACDMYVQPSRYEGKSITVREAQILKKPVLVDNYPTACSQIINGYDGVIVPTDIISLSKGLADFIIDQKKQAAIVDYLNTHNFGNEQEIEKIYNLINA